MRLNYGGDSHGLELPNTIKKLARPDLLIIELIEKLNWKEKVILMTKLTTALVIATWTEIEAIEIMSIIWEFLGKTIELAHDAIISVPLETILGNFFELNRHQSQIASVYTEAGIIWLGIFCYIYKKYHHKLDESKKTEIQTQIIELVSNNKLISWAVLIRLLMEAGII